MFQYFKKRYLAYFSILIASVFSANAQDIITLRNGDEIRARVSEISATEIKYKRFENLDGPTIVVARSEIFAINYENGTRELINPVTADANANDERGNQQNRGVALGINGTHGVGNGPIFPNWGLGAALTANLNKNYRMEATFTYFRPTKEEMAGIAEMEMTMWNLSLNWHYMFLPSERISLFPLAGVGIVGIRNDLKTIIGDQSESDSEICFNLGGGFDIKLSDNLYFNSILKFKIGNDWNFLRLSAGLAFKFN